MFSSPAESPTCAGGTLPEQLRLPLIELVTYSLPSGSVSTLLVKLTDPLTVFRMKPNQNTAGREAATRHRRVTCPESDGSRRRRRLFRARDATESRSRPRISR